MATEKDIRAIAHGGQAIFDKTYEHPDHGELRFTAKLPTALQLTQHSIAMDNMLADLQGEASIQTQVMVAAIAGLRTLIVCPVVSEEREEDTDSGRTVVTKVYYDPEAEIHESFVGDVWRDYAIWRAEFVNPQKVGDLKNSSGETNGNGSSESSTATTASPSTIPA